MYVIIPSIYVYEMESLELVNSDVCWRTGWITPVSVTIL